MGGICLLVELHREGSAPAACAAGLFFSPSLKTLLYCNRLVPGGTEEKLEPSRMEGTKHRSSCCNVIHIAPFSNSSKTQKYLEVEQMPATRSTCCMTRSLTPLWRNQQDRIQPAQYLDTTVQQVQYSTWPPSRSRGDCHSCYSASSPPLPD